MATKSPIEKRVIDMHGYIQRAEHTEAYPCGRTQLHLLLRSDLGPVTADFSFPTGEVLTGVDPFDPDREIAITLSLPLQRELILREKISAHLATMDLQTLESIDCLLAIKEKCK